MACIVKKHNLKVLFKEMQPVAFFIFHMGKTRMQVKNDLRCLRQTSFKNHRRHRMGLSTHLPPQIHFGILAFWRYVCIVRI